MMRWCETLASGRLERLFEAVTMPTAIYSVAYPTARADDPMIREFRDWIFAEIQRDQLADPQISAAE